MKKIFKVKIIRESGQDHLTGEFYPFIEESFIVSEENIRAAYIKSQKQYTMKVRGQLFRTFINGEEYFNPDY